MPLPARLPTSRVLDPRDAPSLRWGVIGTGWIAERFVESVRRHTDQQIVAVAARNADRAAVFARDHHLERSHRSTDDLVAAADIDVVYVATTHPAHLPVALQSLQAGKHTVVEKPLGLSASEAQLIKEAARESGVFCLEALWTLFLPKFDVIRQVLADGWLGEIRSVQADHGEWFAPDHRIFDAAQAGGPMMDLGTYPVSFATWVLGRPSAVGAVGHDRADGLNLEAAAFLTTDRAQLAVVHTTVEANTPTRASINGTAASLEIDGPFYQPGPFRIRSSDGISTLTYDEPATAHDALFYEAVEAARCIGVGLTESPIRPLDDSIATLAVMDEIRAQLGINYAAESPTEPKPGVDHD